MNVQRLTRLEKSWGRQCKRHGLVVICGADGTLVNGRGRPVTPADLEGRPAVVYLPDNGRQDEAVNRRQTS